MDQEQRRAIETADFGKRSSNVGWARYNLEHETLEVDFKNAAGVKVSTYAYDGTLINGTKPAGFLVEEWRRFQEAIKPGEHFAYHIRPKYKGRKL